MKCTTVFTLKIDVTNSAQTKAEAVDLNRQLIDHIVKDLKSYGINGVNIINESRSYEEVEK